MTDPSTSILRPRIFQGSAEITADHFEFYLDLVEVTGDLTIQAEVTLPYLTRVGGCLSIECENISLPALERVGDLDVIEPVTLPALKTVESDLSTNEDANLPALETVGRSLDIVETLTAPKLRSIAGHELADEATLAQRIRNVATAALATEDSLHMLGWHRCETSHCIAGWGVHLEGAAGYELEREVGNETAGAILLGVEAANLFYADTDAARAWLQSKLKA